MSEPLSEAQVDQFVHDGLVRVDDAFPAGLAAEARAILWRDLAERPDDPSTWIRPVARLGMYVDAPFVRAAATPVLHAAFDRLVGAGRWRPVAAMGTFVVRFPDAADPGDTGWHVDMSFGHDLPDFMDWRINIASRGRALLMLFLFSDVGEDDAPTLLCPGSHRAIARALAPAGEAGLSLRQLVPAIGEAAAGAGRAAATGPAGTVYLCHPFLVHAAQRHRGTRPRFLAQPPLLPRDPPDPDRGRLEPSPVEIAIRRSLAAAGG